MAQRLFLRVSASSVGLLLIGCASLIGVGCVTEVPFDHTLTSAKLNWGGDYNPITRKIRINKENSKEKSERVLKHELCHVAEWRNCEALGTRTGLHSMKEQRDWNKMSVFNKNCEEE